MSSSYFRRDPGAVVDEARRGIVAALLGQLARVEGEIDALNERWSRVEPCGTTFREVVYENAVSKAEASPEWEAATTEEERREIGYRYVVRAIAQETRKTEVLLAQCDLIREQLRLFGWRDTDPYEQHNEEARGIRFAEASHS